MGRSWHENDAMYEKCRHELVVFDIASGLSVGERLPEVLSKTELKLVAVLPCETDEIDRDMFDLTLVGDNAPEMYVRAAEKFGVPFEKVAVCTASETGADFAEKNGMTVYRVTDTAPLEGLQDFLGFCE